VDAPVLGTVTDGPVTSAAAVDSYRRLRTVLANPDTQVVQLSPVDGDTNVDQIGAQLATATSLTGTRTIVVDATGRHADRHGLTEGADGHADVFSVPEWAADPDLATGASSIAFFDQLRRDYQRVIVVTQRVGSGTAASVLIDHADGVVLVVEPGRSKKSAVEQSADDLRSVGGRLLGVLAAG